MYYLECEKTIQAFTPLSRKSLIDNMEPERRVRLHKFNSLRCRRQAYPCTVTQKYNIISKKIEIELQSYSGIWYNYFEKYKNRLIKGL